MLTFDCCDPEEWEGDREVYWQCRLVRGPGVTRHDDWVRYEAPYAQTTVWLPERYAAVGKVLRLKEDDGWSDGWVVVEVWQSARLASHTPALRSGQKRKRQRG